MSRALYQISLTKPAVRHELGPLRYVTAMGMAATPLAGLSVPVNIVALSSLPSVSEESEHART
ncbi:hypothetical protein [Methylocella sp.]|uniref:hypothetical protein n=1 Tax=Methylocella sp. TaxID=1978226 RepID=UPI0037841105